MTIHWKAAEQHFTVVLFVILKNLSILDMALSATKGFKFSAIDVLFLSPARYIVHNIDWGSVSVINALLNNQPFGVVVSFSDGTVENSTGVPYFYLSAFDPVVKSMKVNPTATLSLSEAQLGYCKAHKWDPEEPLCSRVSLTGKVLSSNFFECNH